MLSRTRITGSGTQVTTCRDALLKGSPSRHRDGLFCAAEDWPLTRAVLAEGMRCGKHTHQPGIRNSGSWSSWPARPQQLHNAQPASKKTASAIQPHTNTQQFSRKSHANAFLISPSIAFLLPPSTRLDQFLDIVIVKVLDRQAPVPDWRPPTKCM